MDTLERLIRERELSSNKGVSPHQNKSIIQVSFIGGSLYVSGTHGMSEVVKVSCLSPVEIPVLFLPRRTAVYASVTFFPLLI